MTRPLDTPEPALGADGIDLFLADPALNGPLRDAVPQPFGHDIDVIAVGPGVTNGLAPPDRPGLRVGARTPAVATLFGYRQATVIAGQVDDDLAAALLRGDLDLLVGGREVVVFALLAHGQSGTLIRRHTARLGTHAVRYALSPAAESRRGERLRQAARALAWARPRDPA